MNKREFLIELIGRKDTYCVREDGVWKGRVDGNPIDKINEHMLDNKYEIGSYNIYGKEGGRAWCKWVCIDVDAHDNINKKPELLKKIKLICKNPQDYFTDICDDDYLIVEETENGFHIWILLEDRTWATDAWKFVNVIRPNLNKLFEMELEYFPKQEVDKFTINKYGNQVKLPFFAGKDNLIIKPIIIKKLDLKKWRKELNKMTQNLVYRKSLDDIVDFPQQLPHPINMEKGEVAECLVDLYNADDWILGKCMKNVIDGSYKCEGHYGHLMRVAIANELLALNKKPEEVMYAFKNQKDFNPSKSYDYVLYSQKSQEQKGRDLCFQCGTIRGYGYCDPNCTRLGVSIPVEKQLEDIDKPKRGSELTAKLINKEEPESWDEVFTLVHELIKNKTGCNYIIKTTRSGTTTATLAQCIQDRKKVLMIAPTKRIFNSTVDEALDIWHEKFKSFEILHPRVVRIGSNIEECYTLKNKYSPEQLELIEEVFPFLIKPICDKCKNNYVCGYTQKIRQMHEYDIIFLTTQKFKALSQIQNEEIFDELIDWADVIFIDEFSYLIGSSYNSKIIYDGEDNINSIKLIKAAVEMFLDSVKIKTSAEISFKEFVYEIEEFVGKSLQKTNIENALKPINTEQQRQEIFGDMDMWSKIYSSLLDYYLKTEDKSVKYVILCFFAIFSKVVYLQLYHKKSNKDGKIYPFIELAYTDDMNKILKKIKIISKRKYVLLTDATIPYLEPHVIFDKNEDDFYVRVGDPNKTNGKQEIIVINTDDKFYYLSEKYKKEIDEFISMFEKDTFVVCKNKRVYYYIDGREQEFDDIDYYRGSKTVGVKNDLRKMIVIGSSKVPHHSHDCMAKMYKDAGYFLDISYVELGSYLENHNAKSHFFQSISRVKDPLGKENSRVIIYGMRAADVIKFLNELDLGHFEVKSISLYDYIKKYH